MSFVIWIGLSDEGWGTIYDEVSMSARNKMLGRFCNISMPSNVCCVFYNGEEDRAKKRKEIFC